MKTGRIRSSISYRRYEDSGTRGDDDVDVSPWKSEGACKRVFERSAFRTNTTTTGEWRCILQKAIADSCILRYITRTISRISILLVYFVVGTE